jgi:hypothetical protein
MPCPTPTLLPRRRPKGTARGTALEPLAEGPSGGSPADAAHPYPALHGEAFDEASEEAGSSSPVRMDLGGEEVAGADGSQGADFGIAAVLPMSPMPGPSATPQAQQQQQQQQQQAPLSSRGHPSAGRPGTSAGGATPGTGKPNGATPAVAGRALAAAGVGATGKKGTPTLRPNAAANDLSSLSLSQQVWHSGHGWRGAGLELGCRI